MSLFQSRSPAPQKWIGSVVLIFSNGKERKKGECNPQIRELSGKSLPSVIKKFQLFVWFYWLWIDVKWLYSDNRLTPPYLVVIALTGLVSVYLRDTSQYWMIEHNDINCPKYWWRNLFYIQNMYPLNDMCMTWSWFLAADFQCFCLTSLLLVIYTK